MPLPLGLVYCGSTIHWPDDVESTPILIGLITFSGYGDDNDPFAGEVGPAAMDLSRGKAIPESFWTALEAEHEVQWGSELDVYLAVAGWTWTTLESDGERVCSVSAEDDGYVVIPPGMRSGRYLVRAGYC